jgi:hypothetical protein
VIDRDPLELGGYRADHLLHGLRDCDLAHLDVMMIHRAQEDLRDDVLNLDQMDAMKLDAMKDDPQMDDRMNLKNLDAKMGGLQMDDQNLDVKMGDLQMVDQNLDAKMGGYLKIRLMKDDRLMDDRNYLVDLNCCDVLPCSYSLISMKLISYDHTRIL